ncbi:MAG: SGNH/GDSL hydrolase family protein [Planctomycetes bacterium]|nr:SGNH/GDSL hydrolase family protein [Planctomycetota bacterium]
MTTLTIVESSAGCRTDDRSVSPGARNSPASPPPVEPQAQDLDSPTQTGLSAIALIWRRLVLFVAGLALVLVAIEMGLSLRAQNLPVVRRFERRLPAPYIEFYPEPNYCGEGVVTNDAGFRYGALPKAKPADEVRIFFLSSSYGFAGATNDTTIPGFMERQLASRPVASGRRVRVINASGPSFCLRQSLVLLVTRVLDYSPDVIVVFHGSETLSYATGFERRPGYPFNFRVRERLHDKVAGYVKGPEPLTNLLMRTRLMQRFHPDLGRNAIQEDLSQYNNVIAIDSLEQYDPYIDTVVEDISKMARLASTFDCRTLVAIPPWKSPILLPGAVERLAERVRGACSELRVHGVTFVEASSLVGEMNSQQLWGPDGVHWDDRGNELVANHLVHALVEGGLVAAPQERVAVTENSLPN